MTHPQKHLRWFPAWLVVALIVSLVTSPVAIASTSNKKPLSMSSVTFSGGNSDVNSIFWTALAQGFFKKFGLNVTYLLSLTNTAQVALLLSGGAQLAVDAPSTDIPAVEQGGDLRSVVQASLDADSELTLLQSFALRIGMASATNTEKGTLQQFLSLKGSHITIGVSNINSGSVGTLALIAKKYGLTFGPGCTTCDMDLVSVGSTTAQTAAIESGKVEAIVGVPPTTVITSPPTVTVQYARIPPLTQAAGNYLTTTSSFISQHPDTLQAFVNGYVYGQLWLQRHQGPAFKDTAAAFEKYGGITSPEEQDYLWAEELPYLKYPYPTRTGYDYALLETNDTLGTNYTLPYSAYVVTRFIDAAERVLGLKFS